MAINSETYLSFILAEETFAVSVQQVLEVLDKQETTKIPRTPEFIRGVINFRGEVLPVVEMRSKFQIPLERKDAKEVIVVFDLSEEGKPLFVGAVVDGVKDVISLASKDINPVPKIGGTEYNTDFIQGMVKNDNGQFIMLLNVKAIFSKEEISLVKQVANE